jgi:hypothetical protein
MCITNNGVKSKMKMITEKTVEQLKAYLKEHYKLHGEYENLNKEKSSYENTVEYKSHFEKLVDKMNKYVILKKSHVTFTLFIRQLQEEKNITNSELYAKVHIDRRLFYKIVNDIHYHPDKNTVVLLGLGFKLNIEEINNLLITVGYKLSYSLARDVVIMFCIDNGIYDINDINALLYMAGERVLSRIIKDK